MDDFGHYGAAVDEFEFVMFMVAWVLLSMNLYQQLQKWNRNRKERSNG